MVNFVHLRNITMFVSNCFSFIRGKNKGFFFFLQKKLYKDTFKSAIVGGAGTTFQVPGYSLRKLRKPGCSVK